MVSPEIVDTRNVLDPRRRGRAGCSYRGMGRS